jgi:hypothetical protein
MQILNDMKNIVFVVVLIVLGIQCTASIAQYYPDVFFPEDRTYQNKALGFTFSFIGNWDVLCDPNNMKENRSNAILLHETGGELLFVGYTVERTQGTRGIAVNLNQKNKEYANEIVRLNNAELMSDSDLTDTSIATIPMVRWIYEKAGFKFAEFFFKIETYNVRIAFWAKPRLFSNFLPVYEEMMGSMILTGRY